MEGTPRKLTVNDALEVLREKVPGGARCPICGHPEWTIASDLIVSVGVWYSDPEPRPDGEKESPWAPLHTLTLICEHCSFIRQHYIEPPDIEEGTEAT